MGEVSLEAYKCREMCENGVNVKKDASQTLTKNYNNWLSVINACKSN